MKNLLIVAMLISLVFSTTMAMAADDSAGAKVVLPDGTEVPLTGLSTGEQTTMLTYLKKVADAQEKTMPTPISESIKEADPEALAEELADVALYLLQLAFLMDINLEQAILDKLAVNYNRFSRQSKEV